MEPFGPFEITRELDSANGATVYRAKKEGGQKDDYIVKLFSLERLLSEESQDVKSELDPLFKDIGGSFTNRVNLQKKAAETSPFFVPILAAGHDGRGAWYATNFYARSVKGMLDRFVALEAGDLHHLILSVVQASLHLKKACGRPHGNLKPSNIFIAGTGKPRASQILVSDALPGEAREAASFELADLRAVGELIYQLVLRRKVDFSSGWVILPVEATKEWTQLFHKNTAGWLNLCNRLLDSRLSLDQYSLPELEADLLRLKPKVSLALVAIPIAAGVLIVGGVVLYFLWQTRNHGKLMVTTDPPGAKVTVTPINEYGNEDPARARTKTTPETPRPLRLSLRNGEYRLSAEYEADNGILKSRSFRISVKAGSPVQTNLYLPHGTLVVLSEPAGASVTLGNKTRTTPYTNAAVLPGEVSIRVELANYLPALWSGKVPTNSVVLASQSLERIQAGRVNVAFTSDPPGATVRLEGGTNHTMPWITGLEDGRTYTVVAELAGWEPQTRRVQFALRDGVNRTNEFAFAYGILQVEETGPAGAEIWVDGTLVDHAPKSIPLPLIGHDVLVKAEGYSNYTARVVFAGQKQVARLTGIVLEPLAGFVRLVMDPPIPGIQVADRTSGRVLVETSARDLQPMLALPPTNYDLIAQQPELGRAQARVSLTAGRTNLANFEFVYGTVVFGRVDPEQTSISSANQSVRMGEPVFQRPGSQVYLARAPGYQERYLTNTVVARQTNSLAVTLSRLMVPLRLVSLPPGARFFTGTGAEPRFDGVHHWLPWGATKLEARLGRLDPVTQTLEIQWDKTNVVPAFSFSEYSILVLTNLPDGVTVKEGNEELRVEPGPVRIAYDKPGTHTFDLYESGIKVDQVTTNLLNGLSVVLQSEVAGREFRNSLGMALVKVPALFGPGKDGWVGKSEVTQAEYERVMGQGVNPSKHKGANLPVENVNWLQAMEFCQKLTQVDSKHPPGLAGKYSLPTLEQWKTFAEGADLRNAVYALAEPAAVGSKGPSNKFGLTDVLGNVREWLDSGDDRNKDFIGGGFRSRTSFGGMASFLNPQQIQSDTPSDDLGFRVLWVPGP